MKKTILFFTENHLQGGGNKYFVDLINSIPSGTNAHILTNKNGFFDVDRRRLKVAVEEHVLFVFNSLFLSRFAQYKIAERIGHLVAPFVFLLNYCWFLIVLVRSKPALVVSNNGGYPGAESTLAMIAAAKTLGIPAMLSMVSMPAKRRKLVWIYDYFLDHVVKKSVQRIIVNSKAQISGLCELRGFNKAQITCIYNGIADVATHCTEAPVLSDKLILGYVGRLDHLKGLTYVLQAMPLCKSLNQLELVVVGDGAEKKSLMQQAAHLGLSGQVLFKGFVNDTITNIHQGFDVFIFPSLWEGLPYSILEAMRSGLPIIATEVGGIPEVINNGKNGLLVPPANAAALANAIDLLAANPKTAERLAVEGRKTFEQEFTIQVMEQRFQNVIRPYLINQN